MKTKYVIGILILLLSSTLAFYSLPDKSKNLQNKPSYTKPSNTNKKPAYVISDEGFTKKYTDNNYNYSFEFPSNETLNLCKDSYCMSISTLAISISKIDYSMHENDLITFLKTDPTLQCYADGPMGSTKCENKKVSEFISQNGVRGYKIEDILTTENYLDKKTKQEKHLSYFFPLNKVQNTGIYFTVDYKTENNLQYLDMIANSFQRL